jgi:beta-lactamase class A
MVAGDQMKIITIFLLMLTAVFTFACDRIEKLADGFPTPPPETVTPAKQLAPIELRTDKVLQQEIESIARNFKGKVGMAALILESGDSVSLNADNSFAMQSVYKLPIAMAVLHLVDDEKLALDQQIGVAVKDFVKPAQRSPLRDKNPNGVILTIRELIQFAMVESDGTASDVLLDLAGGPEGVQRYLAAVGVGKEMVVANPEKEIGQNWSTQFANWTTPDTAVTLLRDLHEGNGISGEHRELLLKFMSNSVPGAKRLKGLLPPGTNVAHKTGTSGALGGVTAATNDIGLIHLPNGKTLAIAVFQADSPSDEKARDAVIAKIAKAVWDRWSGEGKSVAR